MVPKIFWVRSADRGALVAAAPKQPLILMGDWCSEDIADTIPKK